ncbi:MAG: hypothetical protein L6Q76_21495 [Polyangiaceae bacterium]|nr:hypothetical protein [Polyangiaceae bacterium]
MTISTWGGSHGSAASAFSTSCSIVQIEPVTPTCIAGEHPIVSRQRQKS